MNHPEGDDPEAHEHCCGDLYDNLTPGDELDHRVAQEVLGLVPCDGWKVQRHYPPQMINMGDCEHDGNCYPRQMPVNYSRSLEAAGAVLEHMRELGFLPSVDLRKSGKWYATMYAGPLGWLSFTTAKAPTIAAAICGSALKAAYWLQQQQAAS